MSWIEDWKRESAEAAIRTKNKIANHFRIDGEEVTESEFEEQATHTEGVPSMKGHSHWRDHKSNGHSCHSKQASYFNHMMSDHNLDSEVHYDSKGDCHISSPQAFKKLNKLRKCVDLDGNS